MNFVLKNNNIDLDKKKKLLINSLSLGGIVLFPTDTVYGLACLCFNYYSIYKIYKIKKRLLKKNFLIFSLDILCLFKIFYFLNLNEFFLFYKKIISLMPGKYSFIYYLNFFINDNILKLKLGIRIPNDNFLLNILKILNQPLFVTSANISNEKPIREFSSLDGGIFNLLDFSYNAGVLKNSSVSNIIDFSYRSSIFLRNISGLPLNFNFFYSFLKF